MRNSQFLLVLALMLGATHAVAQNKWGQSKNSGFSRENLGALVRQT